MADRENSACRTQHLLHHYGNPHHHCEHHSGVRFRLQLKHTGKEGCKEIVYALLNNDYLLSKIQHGQAACQPEVLRSHDGFSSEPHGPALFSLKRAGGPLNTPEKPSRLRRSSGRQAART
eukprot:2658071-Pyramimonas_sp.AAC.1